MVTSGAFGIGQVLLFAMNPELITGFAIASIITSLAVAPVALSEDAMAPAVAERVHISLRELAKVVPTGVGSCLLVGIAHGVFTGMAAIYATRVGLSPGRIGLFVAAPNIGGMLLHWPVSAASDYIDRRAVGLAASLGAIGAAALLLLGPSSSAMALLLMALLGGFSYPLYSIAAAYTNDWIEPEHVNAAAAAGDLVRARCRGRTVRRRRHDDRRRAPGLLLGGHRDTHRDRRVLHLPDEGVACPLAKRPWNEVSRPARAFFGAGHAGSDGAPLSRQGHRLSAGWAQGTGHRAEG